MAGPPPSARPEVGSAVPAGGLNQRGTAHRVMPEELKELMSDEKLRAGPAAIGDVEQMVRQNRADAEMRLRSG